MRGIFETHLTVSDLDRSVAFYRDIVGLPLAMALPERGAAFFWVTEPGKAMIGLWSLGSAPLGLSLHVAFNASVADVLGACDRLRSLGVAPLSFFGTDTTEPSVIGWMPAAAVYFRDPDGHCWSTWRCSTRLPVPTAESCPGRNGSVVRATTRSATAQHSLRAARHNGRVTKRKEPS